MRPVLVVGARGRIGRRVVDELVRLRAPVRALVRQTDRPGLPADVEVVSGDLTTPASLDEPLDGVETVFLVWTAPAAAAESAVDRIDTAAVKRVVYLSAPHRTPHPFFQQPNPMREVHVEVERLLAASGMATTILRPGMFSSNSLHWWAPQLREGDVVRWPYGAVETAPIDELDVARVAVRALLDDRHGGGDYVLTGPESLSQAEQVRIIGDAVGRPIRFEELTPDEFQREAAATWPPSIADMLLSAWGAALGLPAFVTNAVAEITGAPARTLGEWAADNAEAFRRR